MNSQELLELENELSFQSFVNHDAYKIGKMIVEKVEKEQLKNVRIRIVYHGDIVFQYLMDGKHGDMWLNRKQKTVETFHHSSYYVFMKNEETHMYQEYENDETMVICGGGFPLIVNHEICGCFVVSGLEHNEDHQLIVDVLREYQNASLCE